MRDLFNKIKTYIKLHKVISIIVLIVVLYIGYFGYGKLTSTSGEIRYVLASVTKGTIISSVSGSGQVSASDQIDVKPSVSGTVTSVNVIPGSKVGTGQTLFIIDSTDAQKAVRDAEIALKNANLSLQKLKIQNSTGNMDANLTKAYSDGFSVVSTTFLDLSPTLTSIEDMFNKNNLSDNAARVSGKTAQSYRDTAQTAFYNAQTAYEKNKNDFNVLDYNSKKSDIDTIISETYDTTRLLATAIKNMNDFVNYLSNDTGRPADFTSYQTTLSQYTNTMSGHISALLGAQESINSYKDSLPSTSIDIESASITVTQKENALADAKQALSNYYIRAPFSGTMASVPIQKGDNASSGTILGTIITSKKVANISLNEVDVAKIALGQKATLTFDAVPNLTISGSVVQIDSLGTVSQGVVNYNVKISFDTDDARIKPGMSVSAQIITGIKQDILTVQNSAIKNQAGTNYVEIFNTPLPTPLQGVQGSPSLIPPINQTIEIGVSDDTSTEVISGLKEGDKVVVKTITTTSTTTSAPSLLNAVSGNRGGAAGGGAARALGR